jgi:hypothetical protein
MGGQAVAESVARRTLFAGFGAGAGGFLGVKLVDGSAENGNGSRGLHMDLLDDGVTWVSAWGAYGIVEVVDGNGWKKRRAEVSESRNWRPMKTSQEISDLVELEILRMEDSGVMDRIRELLVTPHPVEMLWDYGKPANISPAGSF